MIEILQVIILSCQISTGFKVIEEHVKYQKKCRKELIECVDEMKNKTNDSSRWSEWRLVNCLKK